MAKHIDQKETEKIVSTLAGWTGPVTWDLIAERCVELLRRKPSRQALARNEDIAIAYDAARSR